MSAGNFLKTSRNLSLREVVADYRAAKFREEFGSEWAAALIYRPPALVIAWALQSAPVTPTMVTVAGLLCLPPMALAAGLLAPAQGLALIVALAIAFMVLDCADGTLARITARSSSLGQFADFAGDICYRLVFYGSIGWVMGHHPALAGSWLTTGGLPVALVAAWMMSFARLCRTYVELRFPPPGGKTAPPAPSTMDRIAGFVSGLDGLMPLFAAAGWLLDAPALFFAWLVLFAALDLGDTLVTIIGDLRRRA